MPPQTPLGSAPLSSQLDHICISFDNGKTTMNFMEAALLIQGSACIYSRKVRRARGSSPSQIPELIPDPLILDP